MLSYSVRAQLQGACSITGCVLSYRVRAKLQGACSITRGGCSVTGCVLGYRVHAYKGAFSVTGCVLSTILCNAVILFLRKVSVLGVIRLRGELLFFRCIIIFVFLFFTVNYFFILAVM